MPHVLNYANKMPKADDPAIYEPICEAIARGHPHVTAASMAGIHLDTLKHWRYKGQAELEALDGEWCPWDDLSPQAQLVFRVRAAQASMADEALTHWRAGEKDWAAWCTLLERRMPADFGRNQRIDITETRTEIHRIELGSATQAILERVLQLSTPLLTEGDG